MYRNKIWCTSGFCFRTPLFFLFINNLPQVVQEDKMVLFTADTNILLVEKDLTSLKGKTAKVKKQLENWFSTNNLIINTEKTKAILLQGSGSSLIHRPILYLTLSGPAL
jgi:uncharacterized protein YxjI